MHSVVICSWCCVVFVASSHKAPGTRLVLLRCLCLGGWIIFEKMQRCCLMLQIGFMFRAGLFYTPGDLHCVLPGMSVWKDQGHCFMLRMWSSLCCIQSWA